MLGEGPTDDINASVGAAEKKFSVDFRKANTKFCLSLHYNGDSSHLFVNGKKSISLKPIIRRYTFLLNFISESVSFGTNVYDFSVDYNAINKSEILNTDNNLMVTNNVK